MRLRSALCAIGMLLLPACSLLVSTSGLSEPAPAPSPDAPAGETGTIVESGVDGPIAPDTGTDTGVDAPPPPCPGLVSLSGWGAFGIDQGVTIAGDALTATVTTTGINQTKAATATYDKDFGPKTLKVTYDIDLQPNSLLYYEPGCSIFVRSSTDTLLRHVLGMDGTELREYVNVYKAVGDDNRLRTVGELGPAKASHHVEVTFTIAGNAAVVDTVVDGTKGHFDSITLAGANIAFFVNCGIPFASQRTSANASQSVELRAFTLAACP